MKPLIVANWKCNPVSLAEAKQLFDLIEKGIENTEGAEVVICPPFSYLSIINNQLSFIKLGAQDCFWEEKGAYTGEISPPMLKNAGCQYVIIGHSERRKYFNETDEIINKKLKAAIKAGLSPIFCIGETETERKNDEMEKVLKNRLLNGLKDISQSDILNSQFSVAYEPVWAIGTGVACDFNDALGANLFIKKVLSELCDNSTVQQIRILYGGSVKSANAVDFIKKAKMDGLLVGGASLKPDEFIGIIKAVIG